jgi:hypothetical protein
MHIAQGGSIDPESLQVISACQNLRVAWGLYSETRGQLPVLCTATV